MPSTDPLQVQLEAFKRPDYKERHIHRLRSLSKPLRKLGQMLVMAGPEHERIANRSDYLLLNSKAWDQFCNLPVEERRKVCEAIFPGIAAYVEAGWQLFYRLPYQIGWARKPFRMPQVCVHAARIHWLEELLRVTKEYEQDVAWFAAWAPHLVWGAPEALGYLFAAVIDQGGEIGQEVFDTLTSSARGEHPLGRMGRHVIRGLLCAARPDGWEFVERLLIGAQREEGLRQVILESVDEAHPQAFPHMLRVILDNNLVRFAAAIRAVDVWFDFKLDAEEARKARDLLAETLRLFEEPGLRSDWLSTGSPQQTYLALWVAAFLDAEQALEPALGLLKDARVEYRFVGAHLLSQLRLVGSLNGLNVALGDADLRVAAWAFYGLRDYYGSQYVKGDTFERLEDLLARLPQNENVFKPLVWDWMALSLDKSDIAGALVELLGTQPPTRLLPYLKVMKPEARAKTANAFKKYVGQDQALKDALLDLVGDTSYFVRASALDALEDCTLEQDETQRLEALLRRKADDLRLGILRMLLKLPDKELFASIQRLLKQSDENQRLAGLDLLRKCAQNGRQPEACREIAAQYNASSKPSEAEARFLKDLLALQVDQYTLKDALGLMDPSRRSRPLPPRKQNVFRWKSGKIKLGSPAAIACLQALDDLVEQNRTQPVEIVVGDATRTELLGNISWWFPRLGSNSPTGTDLSRLPLHEVWEAWLQARPPELRDEDGLELLRALAVSYFLRPSGYNIIFDRLEEKLPEGAEDFLDGEYDLSLRYKGSVETILKWLAWAHPVDGETEFLVDAVEETFRRIPEAEMTGVSKDSGIRTLKHWKFGWLQLARWHRDVHPACWSDQDHARLWGLVRWLDEPQNGILRYWPDLEDALAAYEAGVANVDDLLDILLAKGSGMQFYYFSELRSLSGRKPHPQVLRDPVLKNLIERIRERILEIELRRGDLPTAATGPALALQSVPGAQALFKLLQALGKEEFQRGWVRGVGRSATLSHLIHVSYPLESDTKEEFASLARADHIPERRLVELAVYAPQWAAYVEYALGWPKFAEGVWWVYAHTKDRQWMVEQGIRELWAAQIGEYTPLKAEELLDGAVDVAWFHLVYSELGERRWKEIYRAAQYASGGVGHTRARLFADAMLGRKDSEEIIERIHEKRHQDSVRALGLVPLPEGNDQWNPDLLNRYEIMQEFMRTGKKFGSQRQASEKLAVSIGLQNLARTAGFPDPQRLEWAMEAEAISDLAEGPLNMQVGDVNLALSINYLGEAELAISRNGNQLKKPPAFLRKDASFQSLQERRSALKRQTSRMRLSLEEAMCRGDRFDGAELRQFFRHPILKAMVEQLVFAGLDRLGYLVDGGRALQAYSGACFGLADKDQLYIAHPVDLLASGEWHAWQSECFLMERIQPFKQIFRELYVLTTAEKAEENLSRRYAGQQVNPRQALALFGTRGWVTSPEEGVYRTFYEQGITARVEFQQGVFTPAEVEGLTLDTVVFTPRKEWKPLPLAQIPPRLFSEVMRDLDLVVSVAHSGGVDPEASASTVEMRAALISETCYSLGIQNVQVKHNHALIEGKLGSYTIHLGSAVVHKQPGGALCIVPVHSQQRGRLFLPFVDNDPKTAEVVSKVLLLARDQEIKDPTILEQIL